MKTLLLSITLGLIACGSQISFAESELKAVMAQGTITELNHLNPNKEKDLLVRLYQVPDRSETCFIETHGICQYKYYVSVATFDEIPEVNVFPLSNSGEITHIVWLAEDKIDYVEIKITLNKYTKESLTNNTSLKNKVSKIILKINPKKIVEKHQE